MACLPFHFLPKVLDVEECLHLPERQWGVSYFPCQTASSEASLQNEFLMLNVMASLLQSATLLSWAYRFNAWMSRVRTWGHSTQWELTTPPPTTVLVPSYLQKTNPKESEEKIKTLWCLECSPNSLEHKAGHGLKISSDSMCFYLFEFVFCFLVFFTYLDVFLWSSHP